MQYFLVILALSACFALIQAFKIKGKGSLWLTIISIIAAVLSVIPFAPVAYDGFVLYAICVLVSFFVLEAKDDIVKEDKMLIYVFVGLCALAALPQLMPFNGGVFLSLIGFVPAFFFFYLAFYKWKNYKNEFGYMAVFAAFSIIRAITAVVFLITPPEAIA